MTKKISAEAATNRRKFLTLSAAAAVGLSAPQAFAAAPAILTGAGDVRALRLYSRRLGESVDTVYWIEGSYIDEACAEIDHLMRDWREDLTIRIDRREFDNLAATHALLETSEPFEIVSGFRSEKTNAMLRRQNRGVARNSYHTRGMAADIKLKTRTVGQMFRAAVHVGGGGVGRYSRSGFVHVDSGPRRDWGR